MLKTLFPYSLAAGLISPPLLLGSSPEPQTNKPAQPQYSPPIAGIPNFQTQVPQTQVQPSPLSATTVSVTPPAPPQFIKAQPAKVVVSKPPLPPPPALETVTIPPPVPTPEMRPELPILPPTPLLPPPPVEPALAIPVVAPPTTEIAVLPPPPPLPAEPEPIAQSTLSTTDLIDLTVLIEVSPTATIHASTPISAYDSLSGEIVWETADPLTIQADGNQVVLEGEGQSELLLSVPAGEMLSVGERAYRGGLIIRARDNHLYVVNHVPIEDFLYSQVSALITLDSNLEGPALDAHVIAARTSALQARHHPNHLWYDLDGTAIDYPGAGVETPIGIQAVEASQGQVIGTNQTLILARYP